MATPVKAVEKANADMVILDFQNDGIVDAVDQSQPMAETLMLTFANLTQVR